MVATPATRSDWSCPACGAALEFSPGTRGLVCPFCGASLAVATKPSVKLDYSAYASSSPVAVAGLPPFSLSCHGCGAPQETTEVASRCRSCDAPLVAEDDLGGRLKQPDGIVEFALDAGVAQARFRDWASSRWFAPSTLQRVSRADAMRGVYLPHWGWDDRTTTEYTGQRGDYYYTTEAYTTTENGRAVNHTKQVRHTRWSPASGQVTRDFVDVLIPASSSPPSSVVSQLGPWNAAGATAYDSQLLAGFDAPRYELDGAPAFHEARGLMAPTIRRDCIADIGGDEQRVDHIQTTDQDVLFRLLLVPLWLASYVLSGRTFHVYVNANTGEVVGDRPYSAVKIAMAILVGLAVLVAAGVVAHGFLASGSG